MDAETRCLRLTMVNRRGLHARAAAKFVNTVDGFGVDVSVMKDGQVVGGRSIMGLLMLAATMGSSIEVHVRGPQADEAAAALAALVAGGFGEAE